MSAVIKTKTSTGKMSWRERLHALKYIRPFIKLVGETHRGLTVLMVVVRVLRSLVPIAVFWTGKLIIDTVLAGRSAPEGGNQSFYRLQK